MEIIMSKINLTLLLTILLSTSIVYADEEEAQSMFDEAKCMDCHAPTHFQNREKKVNNYNKLSDSVRACAQNNDAGWFDEDSDEVTSYLNHKYYHYKDKPAPKEEED